MGYDLHITRKEDWSDEDMLRKMLLIADILGAKVQGDDGEIYTRSNDNQILIGYSTNPNP